MILQSLYDLHSRLVNDSDYDLAPEGFSKQKVTFVVVLNPDGSLFDIQDARVQDVEKKRPRIVVVPGATKKSGSKPDPCFLWDNSKYLLGYDNDRNKPDPARAKKTFAAFKKKHLDLEKHLDLVEFSAVCRFLERWQPEMARKYPILDEVGPGYGVFQIRGETRYVHEHPEIVKWWNNRQAGKTPDLVSQCLVTGKTGPIAGLHPKIKNVSNKQAPLVSFNKKSFESYGKEQSFNAPVTEDVAKKYVQVLNALITGPMKDKHSIRLGGNTVVFWTTRRTVTEDVFAAFMSAGSTVPEGSGQDEALTLKLKAFIKALKKGKEAYSQLGDDLKTDFYLLVLAPNAARISIRLFQKNSLTTLLDNLRRHFNDIGIERRFGEDTKNAEPEYPPLWLLLRQTARDSKDIPPLLSAPLLDAVIDGKRYPDGLYQAVMRRTSIERKLNYPRASVIKGYLVRNQGKEVPVTLDNSKTDPSYRLGRLFAALEKTQKDALGEKLNRTIRDAFYSSASATPAVVFPRLLRTYQHHLSKLEGGWRVNREKLVQEIMEPLDSFPAHLSLEEQGMFAIGYYHQMNDFYKSREKSKEKQVQE